MQYPRCHIWPCVLNSPQKCYVARFWKFCSSRASRQLNSKNLGPSISKVYIFWKQISWGIQIWHVKCSRVRYQNVVTNWNLIFRTKKWKIFRIHIFLTVILPLIPNHIWIPLEISFQKMYNSMRFLFLTIKIFASKNMQILITNNG